MRDTVKVGRFEAGNRTMDLIFTSLNATTLLLSTVRRTRVAVHRVQEDRGRDVAIDDTIV